MNTNPIKLDVLTQNDLQYVLTCLNGLDGQASRKEIADKLKSNGKTGFLADFVKKNEKPLPLRSCFRIAVKRHEANCCLREYPYLDMEYWDSYSSFYSRCFRRFEKTCERLHFFNGPEEQIEALYKFFLDGEVDDHIGAAEYIKENLCFKYIGFVVLRPTQSYCVGRSALLFDNRRGADLPFPPHESNPEYAGRPRIKGASRQSANLLCANLRVEAVPYLQQDVVTGVCATASAWTASQVLAECHELHKFPYLEITRQAVGADVNDNMISKRGLEPPEIIRALRQTGARVEYYLPTLKMNGPGDQSNVKVMRNTLYSYIESNIPVIVLLSNHVGRYASGHAVCCIGHLQPHITDIKSIKHNDQRQKMYPKISQDHYFVSETLTQFYVHNDSYGPYDRLKFLDALEHENLNLSRPKDQWYRCPVVLPHKDTRPVDIRALIVPVHPYSREQSPNDMAYLASMTFTEYFRSIKFCQGFNILWRILLIKGSAFKQTLAERKYPPALRAKYSTLHLPKYIWLCELSLFKDKEIERVLGASDRRKIHGEFIFDSSMPSFHINLVKCRVGPYFFCPPEVEPKTPNEYEEFLTKSRLDGVGYEGVDCFL